LCLFSRRVSYAKVHRGDAWFFRRKHCPSVHYTWVEIKREHVRYRYRKLFRVVKARLRYRRSDGKMSEPTTLINFERKAVAAGVLAYDPRRDEVVLVKQFRYPVYAGLSPEERAGEGAKVAWVLEVVAGIAEGDQSPAEVAKRELLEEAGYAVSGDLNHIATVYPSPGASSELVYLYWTEVEIGKQAQRGGGLAEEGEDIKVIVLPLQEALDMVAGGQIRDAKTVLCLLHLKLRTRRRDSLALPQPRS
jgi:ADP-ribose pyrophosphatase